MDNPIQLGNPEFMSVPHPDIETPNETNTAEPRGRPRGKICRLLGKVKNGVVKKISRSKFNDSRIRDAVQDASTVMQQGADPRSVNKALQDAGHGADQMKQIGGHARPVLSAGKKGPAALDSIDSIGTAYLQPLRIFDTVIGTIAEVHPYAKMALGVLSCASKIILAQANRDEAVLDLYKKLGQVYGFITQDDALLKISSMRDILGQISQQTLECANFIRDYSEKKSFWERLGKNIVSETNDTIRQYNDVLDALMQNFRDQVTRDVATYIHDTSEILEFSGMAYAEAAGLDTRKRCLRETRTDILSDIMGWINDSGDDVPRVLWLSGPAGTGKSAIAHTIASSFIGVGGLGACYCFDRNTEDRHKKVFSTIARDLADRHPEIRRALAHAVKNQTALKTTPDVVQQWQKLLVEPLGKLCESPVGPVVIVIDALDESGEAVETRSDLLRILSGKLRDPTITHITKLPKNFRIIVTSRPLRDVQNSFAGAQHIRRISMDDIPLEVTERDICTYISEKLEGLSDFGSKEFTALAKKADGLFEWARLACKYIEAPPLGSSSVQFFNVVVSRDGVERGHLLYDMYDLILKQIIPKDRHTDPKSQQTQLAMFRSVMGQILGTAEPLSLNSLNAMRSHFPDESERYKVEVIVEHMGSLLSGTTSSSTPIRPLHASFRDFLTDQSHSREFFVDVPNVQRILAFASLGVMKDELSFNICDLKSSYLPNSEDSDLPERVKKCIPQHLSYTCRFWPTHAQEADFDPELAKEIKSFFDHERLFFWLEVLCFINALSGVVPALPPIAKWLKGCTGYEDVSSAAMDVQRFIQVFGGMILHSTPHLYVSALPFSPLNSAVSRTFSARFPNSLRVASGRDINWTAVLTVISGHTGYVNSVSFSPDGTRIATGSSDCTVRLWDAATGQPVGQPLLGHTDSVTSVSFSPDGTRIASGSVDNTVRLWDVATWQAIGEPLSGHTWSVNSVAFSPNGTRIVSGSYDKTLRLWDAATRQPVGEPLEGHTKLVTSVSFSPDGKHIVSGSFDQSVRLWSAGTGEPVGEPLLGHTGEVISVSFSPDGTRIVSGSRDLTVRLWDVATRKPVREPMEGHTDWVRSVSFSPDGSRIVTGSDDNTVRLWDSATGKPVGEPLLGHTYSIYSVSFSPDGTRIATGSVDFTVRLWDASTGKPAGESLRGHTNSTFIISVSLSPDGTRFATGSNDGTVQLLDATTGCPVGEPLLGHAGYVRSVSFSPDGTRIVTGSQDCTVRLWDAGTGQLVGEPFRGHTGEVNSVSFSPDGTRIVSGSDDKTVRLWDAGTGKPVGEPLEGHTDLVWSVSFSPDGTRIVTGSRDETVRLWDAGTGQLVGEPFLGHTSDVRSVSFSPDGTRIVSGSDDMTVRLWDAVTGKSIGELLEGHTDMVWSVSFSPDGSRIVTGSEDKTIRLWDVATGQPVGEPLRGHTAGVNSVFVSRDETRIISSSWDGSVRVWYAVIGKSLQKHAEEDCSAFPPHGSCIPDPTAAIPTSNTANDAFISYSSNPTHSLRDTAELLTGTSYDDHTFVLREDGWIMGPNRRLLFWVPPASQKALRYNPRTTFAIPRGVELDLSRMAHGTRWQDCYKDSSLR